MERLNLKKLVTQSRELDQEAFSILYKEYITPVYRFLYIRTGNRDLAQDLTHTTFVKAWEARSTLIQSHRAWLISIARNTLIDYWRKKKEIPLDDTHTQSLLDESSSLEYQLDKDRQRKGVYAALSQLSDEQQEIIILKFISELDNKTIARVTKKSQTAIRSLQYRALTQLRRVLRKENNQGYQ
ncbi:MAG: sigma-70 family RNA polymerase sigma factor [Candidatus Pacebacteria bacterium]|nr:sigma-70 family RNA polymerase sigma factor [Candidatus Paceibacterota bacterium]